MANKKGKFGFEQIEGGPFSHVNTCTTHLSTTGRGKNMFCGRNLLTTFGIIEPDVADLCRNSLPFRKDRYDT